MLYLRRLTEADEQEWRSFWMEFEQAGEAKIPAAMKSDGDDFAAYLRNVHNLSHGIDLPSGFVPSDVYFLFEEGNPRVLGAVDIRRGLTDTLLRSGGNIGYGIRPSERRKGYGMALMGLALNKCRDLSMRRVLITCDKQNTVSAHVISQNGAVLENEQEADGITVQRRWAELEPLQLTYSIPAPEDAQRFSDLQRALDFETKFMMFEAGERPEGLGPLPQMIESAQNDEDFLLLAWDGSEPVGFLSAQRGLWRRIAHTAHVVIGIRGAYRGKGIGTRLFAELDGWAKRKGISRLELTVVADNAPARHLYKKCGFSVEGTRKNAMCIDGVLTDELYMAKLF